MKQKKKWKILGVDHITIAVKDLEFWKKRLYVGGLFNGEIVEGGDVLDAVPDESSSMKLCGVQVGSKENKEKKFVGVRFALVQGLDRKEKSQVTRFVMKHGDHSFQHVAIAVSNLRAFVRHAKKMGFKFLGPVLERRDLFGPIRQVFAKRFDADTTNASEGVFYEFVERPEGDVFQGKAVKVFSGQFAKKLYRQIEQARKSNDLESFVGRRKKRG